MIKFTHLNGIFLTLVIKQKLLGAYFYIRKYLKCDLFYTFVSEYPSGHDRPAMVTNATLQYFRF